MSDNLVICPECGGVVGATAASEHGQPCSCYKTVTTAKHEAADSVKKICVSCGKDVTHEKRAKDSLGYWCYECHTRDKARQKPTGTPCPGCGRLVKDSALVEVNGRRVCVLCREAERQEVQHQARLKGAPTKEFRKEEIKNLYLMVGILIVLLILGAMGYFGVFSKIL
jgi:DNA-directed RNA polymerase subunit RPC12/RpoP